MITNIPRNLAVEYDMEKDMLVARVPESVPALSTSMLKALCDRIYNIDLVRYKQTPPGDRKDIFEKKLLACKKYRIQQIFTGQNVELFKSTKSTNTKQFYHG